MSFSFYPHVLSVDLLLLQSIWIGSLPFPCNHPKATRYSLIWVINYCKIWHIFTEICYRQKCITKRKAKISSWRAMTRSINYRWLNLVTNVYKIPYLFQKPPFFIFQVKVSCSLENKIQRSTTNVKDMQTKFWYLNKRNIVKLFNKHRIISEIKKS